MISSFFSKAKPVHFVIVSSIVLLVFVVAKLHYVQEPFSLNLLGKQSALFLICLTSLFVLDFFVSRNNLTKKNSYKLLIFSLFIALLPETILDSKILLANLFVLLAFRRLISLRSKKEIKKKLFDAAFWISIAALFYFWALLFFILIIAGLLVYSILGIKNWIVPLIGVITVGVIWTSYMIVANYDIVQYFNTLIDMSFDFSQWNSKRLILGITLILSYGIWALFYMLKDLGSRSKKSRPSYILIVIGSLVGLFIIGVAPNKNGSEFLFLFAPLAIVITNYLETISEKWFKEALIVGLIVAPLVTLML
ncbi:hypothetical protein OE09_0044 [Flavobacteriaceae bacterium MAR_2010_72]|nr:hypothetical protein OE09_0044 [Flavobacteriaceae bacterium MAR_2010_72]TVZ58252.1 hypothetical protein NA63_0748 [Flavobacteriaceae bacterium MAR_2010_105]